MFVPLRERLLQTDFGEEAEFLTATAGRFFYELSYAFFFLIKIKNFKKCPSWCYLAIMNVVSMCSSCDWLCIALSL